ncbi:MAG: lactate utilization protein [Oscillospiraceae bacterium]|nr:lactate utilization protein [Candidatus Ruminococcus equi]
MKELDMKKIEITLESLRKNNMEAYYCDSSQDAVELVKTLIKKGDTVTHGGSETLKETKVIDLLKNGDYNYLDRSTCKDKDEIEEVYRKAYFADAYFASSNAVTENGVLYNVDGNSNRVSAILYGPKSVIMLCGYNKVVRDLDEAVYRVKTVAAPKNTKRLNCATFCKENGQCLSIGSDASYMCDGCNSEGRICCNYVVSAKQRQKGRIKVIIIGEKLGY